MNIRKETEQFQISTAYFVNSRHLAPALLRLKAKKPELLFQSQSNVKGPRIGHGISNKIGVVYFASNKHHHIAIHFDEPQTYRRTYCSLYVLYQRLYPFRFFM